MTITSTTTRTIIPALPGWYVVTLIEADNTNGSDRLDLTPIVAWEINNYCGQQRGKRFDDWNNYTMTPLLLLGINTTKGEEPYLVKTPDGHFILPETQQWDTEAEAIAGLRDQTRRQYPELCK